MSERLSRLFPSELEVRASGDGRTVAGLAVPFDRPADVGRYREVFVRGAFARTIAERGAGSVKLLANHRERDLPIGRATVLREDPAGLYGEFRVSKTGQGDEVLELVRDGALDGLSVSFVPVRQEDRTDPDGRPMVVRLEVKLREVSLTAFPAYEDARVLALRSTPRVPIGLLRRRLDFLTITGDATSLLDHRSDLR
ncbi:MAG: HK97 family phage prohead protease [Acidimicrobiia bacterium]|nr:HK97 family phage prohead protease [Acidimicrobiia bacterium]